MERADRLSLLSGLVDSGLTTFDCADIYLGVEELLGSLIRDLNRSERGSEPVRIHTKYVPDRSTLADLDRATVAAAIDGSLSRLGIERLDLVQLHWWDYQVPRYVEVAGWLNELRLAGKIRHLGTTNFDPVRLAELVAAGIPIVSNQVQVSLLDRRALGSMTDFCIDNQIGLLAYGVLAGGFLGDRYLGRPEPEEPLENRSLVKYKLIIDEFGGWPLHQELLEALGEIAAKHRTSVAAVAARWTLNRKPVSAVMIGTRSDRHVADNLRVFDLELDNEDDQRIAAILAHAKGPDGAPYDLERDSEGRHAKIMWTNLNERRES